MTDSESSDEPITPRRLTPRDERVFNHWRKTFASFSLHSASESTNSSSPSVPSADARLSERQHKGCVSLINKLFETSPIIIFMNSELKKIGDCSPRIYCAPCSQPVHGGFHPDLGIVICENNIPSRRRMESTLTHEMVHAFDHCRFKFDHNNLKHLACAEVSRRRGRFGLSIGQGNCLVKRMSVFR